MKFFPALAALALASTALVGCSDSSTNQSSSIKTQTPDVDSMLFGERAQMLATYRPSSQMCNSNSGNCMVWTGIALKCELSLAQIEKGNYSSPYRGSCTEAESFRERVTKIELSSHPGAYKF